MKQLIPLVLCLLLAACSSSQTLSSEPISTATDIFGAAAPSTPTAFDVTTAAPTLAMDITRVTPTMSFVGEMGYGYRLVLTETVGNIPANTRVAISHAELRGNNWIYIVYAEDGRQAEVLERQLAYAPDVTPGYIPPMRFQGEIGMGVMRVVTLEQVGSIPAGTKVRVSTASFNGTEWVYSIATQDDATFADARESQLEYAPDATPGAPTPTAGLDINASGYRYITREQIGDIPAGASVAVMSMWMQNNEWRYSIATVDGVYAEAREEQLQPAPDITAGPTPTANFQSELGMGVYRVITLVQIGAIPANTRVSVSMATFDGRDWVYTIATRDGVYEQASGEQLAYAPDATPGAPTPSN
jgi:hypothetical protein